MKGRAEIGREDQRGSRGAEESNLTGSKVFPQPPASEPHEGVDGSRRLVIFGGEESLGRELVAVCTPVPRCNSSRKRSTSDVAIQAATLPTIAVKSSRVNQDLRASRDEDVFGGVAIGSRRSREDGVHRGGASESDDGRVQSSRLHERGLEVGLRGGG